MLCPGYFQVGKIKTMKQNHKLTSQIMQELVRKTEVWAYGGTGMRPQEESYELPKDEPDEHSTEPDEPSTKGGILLLTQDIYFSFLSHCINREPPAHFMWVECVALNRAATY